MKLRVYHAWVYSNLQVLHSYVIRLMFFFIFFCSALSKKDNSLIKETDFQVAQRLCQHVNIGNEEVHVTIINFLGNCGSSFNNSIKLGQFLLFLLKKMGRHLIVHEAFNFVINNHSSGLKKGIESQLKRL